MTNPSAIPAGYGQPRPVPPEIDRWNWGAFLLHWIWGIGNRTYIAFLVFVPFFGILVMPFVLGAKGSAWAWQNRPWTSIEEFRRVQRRWAFWGVIVWIGAIVATALSIAAIFALVSSILASSDAYRMGVARVSGDQRVIARLGSPVTAGWPSGSINVENSTGTATLGFSVSGPKGDGHVELDAVKSFNAWSLRRLQIKIAGDAEPIDLLDDRRTLLEGGTRSLARLEHR